MRFLATAVAFFLSGTAALVYQTVWQRIVALHTGIGLESVAVIVASFMVGLGLGSHLGGSWSVRLGPRAALLAFGAVEMAIAAWGAASAWIYYDVLYTRASALYAVPVQAALLHAVTLGLPTTLMGMSLPLLVRASVHDARLASRTIGILYALNVLGAAAGAVLGPVVLVRHAGMRTAVQVAALANVVAGLVAFALARRAARADVAPAETAPAAPAEAVGGWALLYAASGFCAIGLELVWFRVFEVSVKASAFTFGLLLAVYLLGNGIGGLVAARLAPRVQRPLHAFLLCQGLLLGYAAAILTLLVRLPATTPGIAGYVDHWGGGGVLTLGQAFDASAWTRLYVVLPLVLFGPSTFLMGASYPILQRAVQDDPRTSGRKVGLLQAANIAGCVAGSLIVGLVLLDRLGTPGTLSVLVAAGLAFTALGLRRFGLRTAFGPLLVFLLLVLAVLPDGRAFWLRFHGTRPDREALVAEDATGVVALMRAGRGYEVWAGGRRHSWLPFGSIHTTLGAAPAVIHPAPRRVAVIGLGSGDTAWAAGCRDDVPQQLDVYEIYAQEHALLTRLAGRPDAPAGLAGLLADRRFRFLVRDGRNALLRSEPEFDLVEMDALWPISPYSGNLYSVEFFALVASRLRPGGLMSIWAPTPRVRLAFAQAFPHAVAVDRDVLVGSREPFDRDRRAWRERARSAGVRAYLGERLARELEQSLAEATDVRLRAAMGREVNEDLFPRDEFRTPPAQGSRRSTKHLR